MDYKESIEYIHGIYWRGSKLGLERIRELLELMGNPQKTLKFVHVAGTNGKGSTCAMLASVFKCAGYRTGLYISPYITRFNERIQYDGRPISDNELAEITTYVSRFAESMKDKPTEFELVTAIGMEYYKRIKCDIVILETGLGGTLDSTNIIDTPEAAVITAIDYDHTRELGNTMESIASAKAGIIKPSGDVVFYGGESAALDVISAKCGEQNARLSVVDFNRLNVKESDIYGSVFDWKPASGSASTAGSTAMKDLKIPLAGTYQVYNAALVLTVIEVLSEKFRLPESAIYEGLASVKWPGRFELLRRDPVFIADGGHNPHGITGTVRSIEHHFPGKKIIAVIGVMADKDVGSILDILLPHVKRVYTVRPDNPRAMDPALLAEKINNWFENTGAGSHASVAIACGTPSEGVRAAYAEADKDDVICALGSFYMYADIADAVRKL